MAKQTSIAELRKMQVKDLQTEARSQQMTVAKLALGVKLRKEKDSAKYKREKKQLARIKTILTEKIAEELLQRGSDSRVSARAS